MQFTTFSPNQRPAGPQSTYFQRVAGRCGRLVLTCAAVVASLAGCAAEDEESGSQTVTTDKPVYAMMTQVYAPDGDRTVYVSLTNGLDFDKISLEKAREFPGVANLAGIGGKLLISEGQDPVINEFEIGDDLSWHAKRSVSFANYPLDDNANFYYHFILNDTTAYLPYDTTKRIIWNPKEMSIVSTAEDSKLQLTKGKYSAFAGGNRNSVMYKDKVLQAFGYVTEDWAEYGPDSAVAVYDPTTHKETALIEIPCQALSIATQDEDHNTYFSAWGASFSPGLYGTGPKPCIARVKPDATLDSAFTTDLTDLTGGRMTNNFRYTGNGKAIANVLHHEALTGFDFTKPYDPAIEDKLWETGPHWKLWQFDLKAGTAKQVEGIAVDIGSGAQFAVHEGRTFVFLPYAEWGKTKVYEIDASAQATERLDITGDIFKWIRVR